MPSLNKGFYQLPKTPFEKVWEFHTAFGQVRNTIPTLPGSETLADPNSLRSLRKRLLEEEYNEYVEGEDNNDLVEIADAIADILYIAYGTAVSYGLPMDEIFNEVHASNMSKLGEDGKPIYREDGKILKGPNFFKPDILSIIKRADSVGFEMPGDTVDDQYDWASDTETAVYADKSSPEVFGKTPPAPALERFAIYVSVGQLPPAKATAHLENVKTQILADAKKRGDTALYYFLATQGEPRIERI